MGTLMNSDPENSPKQDLNDSGCVQDASVTENGYKGQAELLDLSDDVLLYILRYCTPRDLKALGYTCLRLGALVCDRTLWTRVDARSSPVGQLRLRWLLKHCLSPATTELKLTGYVNRESRCLGIQDLSYSFDSDAGLYRGGRGNTPGADVEHFLLRMWYPHLPRYAVSPRWPDAEEAASRAPQPRNAAGPSTATPSSSGTTFFSTHSSSRQNTNPMLDDCLADEILIGPRRPTRPCPMHCSSTSHGSRSSNMDTDPLYPDGGGYENCKGPQFTLTAQLLRDLRLKCAHLTSLALDYCNIDYKTTHIRQFPPHLKKLSLRGCRCYNLPLNTSYLGKIQERLPELEYLDVSECDWFEPASLMPISKLPVLKELHMRDCTRLTECVAYASLATRYGFRQLRVIDVRGSPLADSEVSAFGWLPELEELYCSPPEDDSNMDEHTHSWNDAGLHFNELEDWETEEPDYYKVKSPEPSEAVEQEDLQRDVEMQEPNAAVGDLLLGNPWLAHESRIIVIQPNANRYEERPARAGLIGAPAQPAGAAPVQPVGAAPVQPAGAAPVQPVGAAPVEPVGAAPVQPVGAAPMGAPPAQHGGGPSAQPAAGPAGASPAQPAGPMGAPQAQPAGHVRAPPVQLIGGAFGAPPVQIVGPFAAPPVQVVGPFAAPPGQIVGAFPAHIVPAQFVERQLNLMDEHLGNIRRVQPIPQPLPEQRANPAPQVQQRAQPQQPSGSAEPIAGPAQPTAPPAKPGPSKRPASEEEALDLAKRPRLRDETPPEDGQKLNMQEDFVGIRPQNEPQSGKANQNGMAQNVLPGEIAPQNAHQGGMGPQNAHQDGMPPQNDIPGPVAPQNAHQGGMGPQNAPQDDLIHREIIPIHIQNHDHEQCPRLRNRNQPLVNIRRNMQPIMHIDVDIQRQSTIHIGNHIGYQLVSDSAIMRFGMADNDSINYVHIGRDGVEIGVDTSMRPERSNLRILSVTGYRNITDRSLEHLATAAPNLMSIDFSQTNVSSRGVDVFKAMRPNCTVTYSRFGMN